ncbi:uncharacterized protein EI90DRAFT_2262637 [Cantharellus anzutake]|uniref:uncharacterized protein n=1 Tax=Cantharellus anzutake TaxID=1750568 RepID=UPI001908088E|nr:uncharacterized protein EI90DRAFT_2262637 [Cantharellus anzutake]KAF8339636.1 hypothetical protein EI90DRAFT_2262637 [Cantharellus anzutake]
MARKGRWCMKVYRCGCVLCARCAANDPAHVNTNVCVFVLLLLDRQYPLKPCLLSSFRPFVDLGDSCHTGERANSPRIQLASHWSAVLLLDSQLGGCINLISRSSGSSSSNVIGELHMRVSAASAAAVIAKNLKRVFCSPRQIILRCVSPFRGPEARLPSLSCASVSIFDGQYMILRVHTVSRSRVA